MTATVIATEIVEIVIATATVEIVIATVIIETETEIEIEIEIETEIVVTEIVATATEIVTVTETAKTETEVTVIIATVAIETETETKIVIVTATATAVIATIIANVIARAIRAIRVTTLAAEQCGAANGPSTRRQRGENIITTRRLVSLDGTFRRPTFSRCLDRTSRRAHLTR